MARSIVFGIAVLLMLGPAVSATRAQDSLLQEMYGQGVHAYFAGKYDQAHELFSTAIDQGSQDPRCYYYRGLAFAKLGRPDEAEADYKRGAELEAGGAAVQINVGWTSAACAGESAAAVGGISLYGQVGSTTERNQGEERAIRAVRRNEPNVLRGESPPAAGSEAPNRRHPVRPILSRPVLERWLQRPRLPQRPTRLPFRRPLQGHRQLATRLLILRNPSRCRPKAKLLTLLRHLHRPIRSTLRCRPRPLAKPRPWRPIPSVPRHPLPGPGGG